MVRQRITMHLLIYSTCVCVTNTNSSCSGNRLGSTPPLFCCSPCCASTAASAGAAAPRCPVVNDFRLCDGGGEDRRPSSSSSRSASDTIARWRHHAQWWWGDGVLRLDWLAWHRGVTSLPPRTLRVFLLHRRQTEERHAECVTHPLRMHGSQQLRVLLVLTNALRHVEVVRWRKQQFAPGAVDCLAHHLLRAHLEDASGLIAGATDVIQNAALGEVVNARDIPVMLLL
ncbi:hypothetical protein DQ04_02551070 [Trypanosoma grayi]|uniref:hypothetical protein n=1 Tax=Trypanosoma grayi TaxID=71804 RepID=UPI0004F48577|nr:hypothetical protein DQ04_02551070 [Trypanosoma grayi]KEG11510.1 hypothetical protein DQ04_02551070 [Trypanosoma grayi]